MSSQRKPTYNAESASRSAASARAAAAPAPRTRARSSRRLRPGDHGRGRLRPVARQTHLTPGQVGARSCPRRRSPDSPFLRIQATGATARRPEGLASAATGALTGYVRRSGATNTQTSRLLQRFRAAQGEAESAASASDRAKKAVTRHPDSSAARRTPRAARTDVETTSLRARGLRSAYLEQAAEHDLRHPGARAQPGRLGRERRRAEAAPAAHDRGRGRHRAGRGARHRGRRAPLAPGDAAAVTPRLTWTPLAGVAAAAAAAAAIGAIGLGPAGARGFLAAALLAAAMAGAYVAARAEPAWLLSAGIAASVLSGNSAYVGLPIGPDRLLLAAGLFAVVMGDVARRQRATASGACPA